MISTLGRAREPPRREITRLVVSRAPFDSPFIIQSSKCSCNASGKVRDVVGLVMLRFETKQPPDSNGWLYSDTTRLTIMDDRTVAERGEDRTFKLMSWIGTSGPTYLTQ